MSIQYVKFLIYTYPIY